LNVHESPKPRPELIVPIGTQVVLRFEVDPSGESVQFQKGTVAEIVRIPLDSTHSYGLRCADGRELNLQRNEFSILKQVKSGPVGDPAQVLAEYDLHRFVIYQCVVGSRAYGLSRDESDVDRRGIYLPPADLHWSIYGVPEQLEDRDTDECYWELQKLMVLALKANPNILECLYTPIVEKTSEISDSLLARREIFLSKLVYQTYNGYVMSQFRKLEQDLRNQEEPSWKHAMHLIRLLLQGISILCEQRVPVSVESHRAELLSIRDGKTTWEEMNQWRLTLHREFENAYRGTKLPDSPDYAEANRILVWARRRMVEVSL
jgi:uncharacterized protein